jgi:hypothetical protein
MHHADLAIETMRTIWIIFHLLLRKAEGFVQSLFGMPGLASSLPDHTKLSRHSRLLHIKTAAGLHRQWPLSDRRLLRTLADRAYDRDVSGDSLSSCRR